MKITKDQITIQPLQKSSIKDTIALLKKTGLLWGGVDTEDAYKRMLEHDPRSVLIMKYGDYVIGMVAIVYSPLVSALYHGCIDPRYQGQELGSMLVRAAEKMTGELGGTQIIAGYIEENNAPSLSMCKKLGYKTHPVPITCVYKEKEPK